jgi:serine/threonine protein kinase
MLVAADPGSAPVVKLLDFGTAKQADGDTKGATQLTGTSLLVGTPGYVAPEVVLEGTTDDPRSDFDALGVIWFEVLTGMAPFTAIVAEDVGAEPPPRRPHLRRAARAAHARRQPPR